MGVGHEPFIFVGHELFLLRILASTRPWNPYDWGRVICAVDAIGVTFHFDARSGVERQDGVIFDVAILVEGCVQAEIIGCSD